MIIKPKALKKGDRVAVIAPSSATDLNNVDRAEENIKAIGLDPVMYPTCYTRYGHLTATDEERAKDINDAFSDSSIKGIICLRGGYGTPRILHMIDYHMIKNNPKIFVGYSDITALHVVFNKICRMVTYHGPMATSRIMDEEDENTYQEHYTYESLKQNIFTNNPVGIYKNPHGEKLESLNKGQAEGELIGGNLSLLVSTLGSPYEINTKGKILFIEEVGEPVYKIDRMLTSLSLAGKFRDCEGIILGTWTDCIQEKKNYENGLDLPLTEVFENTIAVYNKPIITNFKAGHNSPQPTMAFGTHVKIDVDKKSVIFTESGNR